MRMFGALVVVLLVATAVGPVGARDPLPPPVVIGPGSVTVTAGAPGSLVAVDEPRPGGGPAIRCTWFDLVLAGGGDWTTRPAAPVEGGTYVLACVHADRSLVAGYPIVVVYDPADPVPGAAVSTEDAARFALRRIVFDPPVPVLSPPGRQVVGVATWLAVTSRLHYGVATAQAGPVWASVRPVPRDVTWRLGDGREVVCRSDATTVWVDESAWTSRCVHVYERASGSAGYDASVTVTWTIRWRNDRHPSTWRVFDTLSLTTPVRVDVIELQSAIR